MLDKTLFCVERVAAILTGYPLNGYNMRTLLRAKRNLDQALIAVIERQNKVILLPAFVCTIITEPRPQDGAVGLPLERRSDEVELMSLTILALFVSCLTNYPFPK